MGRSPLLAFDEDPDCLQPLRRRMARMRRAQTLRGLAVICCLGLISGYLGARIDPMWAQAGGEGAPAAEVTEQGFATPGYVVLLDEAQEAAAPPSARDSQLLNGLAPACAGDACDETPSAWRSSIVPELQSEAGKAEALALTLRETPSAEITRAEPEAESLPVVDTPIQAAKVAVSVTHSPKPKRARAARAAAPRELAVEQCWAEPSTADAGPEAMRDRKARSAGDTMKAIFVVVGSYTDPMNALKAYARVEDSWRARIVHIEVADRLYRRVLVGPFKRDSLAAVRRELAARGLTNTWALGATCQAPAPAKQVPQQQAAAGLRG